MYLSAAGRVVDEDETVAAASCLHCIFCSFRNKTYERVSPQTAQNNETVQLCLEEIETSVTGAVYLSFGCQCLQLQLQLIQT